MAKDKRSRREDRSRVLQQPEQHATDLAVLRPTGGEEAPPVRVEVLVEFTRALIRENPSSDLLYLAMAAAKRRSEATDDEMELLKIAVLSERLHSTWPEGFFS